MTTTKPCEETYSTCGPTCPYCGEEWQADEPFMYDETTFTEFECPACEKTMKVRVYIETSWTCEPLPDIEDESYAPDLADDAL